MALYADFIEILLHICGTLLVGLLQTGHGINLGAHLFQADVDYAQNPSIRVIRLVLPTT